jgi:hypothetical protein
MAEERPTSFAEFAERIETHENLQRALLQLVLENARERSPELAEAIRYCAIPRFFDVAVLGALRGGKADKLSDSQLLAEIASFSFVIARPGGSYAYHDNMRDLILREWNTEEQRPQFEERNEKLISFYELRQKEADQFELSFRLAGDVIHRANPARYQQIAHIIGEKLISPLVEALYHSSLISAERCFNKFTTYFSQYESRNRHALAESLVSLTKDYISQSAVGTQRDHWLLWLDYYSARIANYLGQAQNAEIRFRGVLEKAAEDTQLKLWTLGELGAALQRQYRLRECREVYAEAARLGEKTEVDRWNQPVRLSCLGSISWRLEEMYTAENEYRKAIESARQIRNNRLVLLLRFDLSSILLALGRKEDALDEALEAVEGARAIAEGDEAVLSSALSCLTRFAVRFSAEMLDTLEREQEALLPQISASQQLRDLKLRYVEFLSNSGQLEKADRLMETLVNSTSSPLKVGDPEGIVFVLGLLREDEGNIGEAIGFYQDVVERTRDGRGSPWERAAALHNSGVLYSDLAQWEKSERDLVEARERWTEMGHTVLAAYAELFRADNLRKQGNLDNALEKIESVRGTLEQSGTGYRAQLYKCLGDLHFDQANWEQARSYYDRAAEFAMRLCWWSTAGKFHLDAAKAAARIGDWRKAAGSGDAAAAQFQKLACFASYCSSARSEAADNYDAQGMRLLCTPRSHSRTLSAAREMFRAAVRLNPSNPWYRLNLASTSAALGDWAEAIDNLRYVLENGPQWLRCPVLERRLTSYRSGQINQIVSDGDSEIRDGETRAAEEHYIRALTLCPQQSPEDARLCGTIHARLAWVNLERNDLASVRLHVDNALDAFRKANQPDPGNYVAEIWETFFTDDGRVAKAIAAVGDIANHVHDREAEDWETLLRYLANSADGQQVSPADFSEG